VCGCSRSIAAGPYKNARAARSINGPFGGFNARQTAAERSVRARRQLNAQGADRSSAQRSPSSGRSARRMFLIRIGSSARTQRRSLEYPPLIRQFARWTGDSNLANDHRIQNGVVVSPRLSHGSHRTSSSDAPRLPTVARQAIQGINEHGDSGCVVTDAIRSKLRCIQLVGPITRPA
jgi:hypothetical protein